MVTLNEYLAAEHDVDVLDARLGWQAHALVYGFVNGGLIIVNLLLITRTSEDFVWFVFPLVCWGIGLFVHYLYAIRWADRQVSNHQAKVERYAEQHAAG